MTAAYHLQLFGIPRLLDPGGAHVRLRTRKQLGLLVYLALEARNRPVGRDVLLELFWPDAAEGLARHSLSQALTAIRRELGAGAVTRAGELVRLLGPLTTDLDPAAPRGLEFGDLANPLDGVDSWAGASLAHWVDGVRTRCLKDMRVRLLNDLMAARSSGQVKAVRERATLLYEVDPLNDRAALSLAEDYLLEQDTAGAIGLLRAHVDRSLEESGHAPTPEIVQLLARLERGLVPEPESPQAMARPEVFVGRKEELSRLEAVWTRVQGTKLCTLIISGPTGIGKSALIRRFCSSVAARARPAYVVGCQEMGRNIPFAAVSDLIHRLARDPALSGTDPLWLAEASRVSPRLRGIYPGIPEPPPAPAEAVRIRVADAMHMMLEAVADGGAMIVAFDNVQHMDPASRDVLHLLLRRLEDVPVLVVGTRLCDANDSFVPTAHSVEDGIEWQEGFYLGPLDDIATNALLEKLSQGVADAADAMAEITKLAQGVPYLIEMLYSEWERNPTQSLVATQLGGDGSMTGWRPPDTMRLAFARQYLGLSTDALHILHLLAVAERVLPSTEIAELLSASQSIVDRAALELIDRALVRVEAGAIGFKNEFHRAFVYYAMSREVRLFHHTRVGQRLAVKRDTHDFQRALEASHHLTKASVMDSAVDAVCLGADLAVKHGAPREAESALRYVLEHSSTLRSQLPSVLLAEALNAQGRYRESVDALSDHVDTCADSSTRALAATIRAEALHRGRLSDDQDIATASSLAHQLGQNCGDEWIAMRSLQVRAEVTSESGDWQEVSTIRTQAVHIEEFSSDSTIRARALLTQGYCFLVVGEVDSAIDRFRQCLTLLKPLSLDPDLRQALNGLGLGYACCGKFRKSIDAFSESVKIASRIGDSVAGTNSWCNLGAVYEDLGNFTDAAKCYKTACSLEKIASNPRRAVEVHLNMASLQMVTGQSTNAKCCIEAAKKHADASKLWWLYSDVLLAEADLHLASGNPEVAWPLVEAVHTHTRGRVYMLADMGRYERLNRQYIHASYGFDAIQRLGAGQELEYKCVQISDRLEVRAFEDWAAQREGRDEVPSDSAYDQLVALGLQGVIERLRVLGVCPSGTGVNVQPADVLRG